MLANVPYRFQVGQVIGVEDPVMGDRVERVSYSDYSSTQWYVSAFQSGWMAAAIPALVVVAHKRGNGGQGRMPADHVSPNVGVTPHNLPLLLT